MEEKGPLINDARVSLCRESGFEEYKLPLCVHIWILIAPFLSQVGPREDAHC